MITYVLHAGMAENHEYTLKSQTLSGALKEVRVILSIPDERWIRKIPTPPGYPSGARHYRYSRTPLGLARLGLVRYKKWKPGQFLLIRWDKK